MSEAERTGAYAGLVTRAIAYCLDIALINVVAFVVGVAVALAPRSSRGLRTPLEKVGGWRAVRVRVWVAGYFVVLGRRRGRRLGSRMMRIRVIDARGAARLKPRRALVRVVGLVLATIPLFAGFWMMLWDSRRRCLQDRMARTTVVHAPPQARIVRQAIPREPDGRDGDGLTAWPRRETLEACWSMAPPVGEPERPAQGGALRRRARAGPGA